jgi:transposase
MLSIAPAYQLFCGVDISAKTFSAATLKPTPLPTAEPAPTAAPPKVSKAVSFEQTGPGFNDFEQWLLAQLQSDSTRPLKSKTESKTKTEVAPPPSSVLIVLEATGHYWLKLAARMAQAGFAIAVLNPSQVHAFARSLLVKPKNDQLDAQLLARFAQTHQPAAWQPPQQLYYELYQRLAHRDSLLDFLNQARNQAAALELYPSIVASVAAQKQQLIATLEAQLKTLETELAALVKKGEDEWSTTTRLIQTIPGIGLYTALWLVTSTSNFTACPSGESLVHYAGLAPVERSSGTSVRYHPLIGHGGNGRLRKALYMASLSALQHNVAVKALVERMRSQGRAGKEICCAVARKLALLAFAVARSGQAFDPGRCEQVQAKKQQQQLLKKSA